MLHTEYVRNLNCNYERILLEKKPEENRYQYCIMTRGGVRGLLSCSLRYINGSAYLYYDISSTQSMAQLFARKKIDREWVKDFLWSISQIRLELDRFLLEDVNLIWYPEQIHQDLEKNQFSFMYVPYYEGDCGFGELLNFLVEHIDYTDEGLVDCVYRMHEQYGQLGNVYLQEQIFEDGRNLEKPMSVRAGISVGTSDFVPESVAYEYSRKGTLPEEMQGKRMNRDGTENAGNTGNIVNTSNRNPTNTYTSDANNTLNTGNMAATENVAVVGYTVNQGNKTGIAAANTDERLSGSEEERGAKKGILYFLEGRKKRQKEDREALQRQNEAIMSACAVSEDSIYEAAGNSGGGEDFLEDAEEIGRTVYMAEPAEEGTKICRLYTSDGRVVMELKEKDVILGKKKGEADCVLEDESVSRLHARITWERGDFYLEDLNSTNGTYKNGLQLQPYEKRRLCPKDEIRLGKIILTFNL